MWNHLENTREYIVYSDQPNRSSKDHLIVNQKLPYSLVEVVYCDKPTRRALWQVDQEGSPFCAGTTAYSDEPTERGLL